MNIESQVTSLELSRRLKELGVKQESLFIWNNIDSIPKIRLSNFIPEVSGDFCISAYTVAELGELLPDSIKVSIGYGDDYFFIKSQKKDNEYKIYLDNTDKIVMFIDENEANARAKMLIWLIENGYVKND